jgi:hypothetical protein
VLMRAIDAAPLPQGLRCYALLRDWMVGATRAAPAGMDPVWVDPEGPASRMLSHFASVYDPRVSLDIATILRGGEPIGRPSTPPRD